MLADATLIVYGERGRLGLVEATPSGFHELAAAQVLGYGHAEDLHGRSLAEQVPIFLSALRKSPGGRPMRTSATSWARKTISLEWYLPFRSFRSSSSSHRCLRFCTTSG